jgi:hypothetical protein
MVEQNAAGRQGDLDVLEAQRRVGAALNRKL